VSRDPKKDARRLRMAFAGGALFIVMVVAVVAVRTLNQPWQRYQKHYRLLTNAELPHDDGLVQIQACTGEVDRCTTCHRGVENPSSAGAEYPLPFRTHSVSLTEHAPDRFGCSACHGGTGRALEPAIAHAAPGSDAADPLLVLPHMQASCARCHVPGDGPGMERLVHGAEIFLTLGCNGCHPLSGEGRGGWDFGPDLRTIGRRSLKYLEQSLVEPTANFQGSTMPSFSPTFADDAEGLTDLQIFLENLVLPRPARCNLRDRSKALVEAPCISCHTGPAGKAGGAFKHRCVYIVDWYHDELRCTRCHTAGIPDADNRTECPFVVEHRKACVACHEETPGGRY
jgi:hypothetical protein